MKALFNKISNNSFFRNVTTLALGTVISQIIVLASSPLLSRLFSVADFGILSVFTSISVFFAVLSTGRYEFAIGLPENDAKAKQIFTLIVKIGFVVSLCYLGIIFILKSVFKIHDSAGFLKEETAWLSPLYIFFIAIYSGLGYWFQRFKKYKEITLANAIQVCCTALLSLGFGYLHIESGMIFSLIIGVILSCLFLVARSPGILGKDFFQLPTLVVAKEYISFPRYMILSDLSLTASQQFIPIIFSVLYNTTIVGFFAMANRMLRLPNIVITSSIANVFRNEAIDELREKGNCKNIYIFTFKKLAIMSFPIYLIIFIMSPFLFEWIFGKEWLQAGYFARILSILLMIEFVASPLNSIFYIVEKQKLLMRIQVLLALGGILMIYLGYTIFKNPYYSLILFCINSLFFNVILLYYSYSFSKKGL
ncbi:lipopolysaccharide biosynthesis protein [Chryseobacterium arthrosphaerae]|uniref:lipopolysaccharide biosynthesis protein n=1 Tax=Chryseobacterium arthrosphaerae TaxID=651561 RepID=UPI001BB04701|nr:oligosaccharide flippase family protein [Chryseobacterium arthrosphaerae]QUY54262.1 oligosaccharide flippase family protein [Chryseobacterium arthrosphaerae]